MAVSKEIIESIKNSNIEDIQEYLQILSSKEISEFWNWFATNAEQYNSASNYPITQKSKHQAGNCYDNSQFNALNFDLEYCEGAYSVEMNSNLVLHGFNIKNGQAIDYTVNANIIDGLYNGEEIPILYYGIIIPTYFINMHSNQTDVPLNNPLLPKYFHYIRT